MVSRFAWRSLVYVLGRHFYYYYLLEKSLCHGEYVP